MNVMRCVALNRLSCARRETLNRLSCARYEALNKTVANVNDMPYYDTVPL